MSDDQQLNVLGEPLVPCAFEPMTGFFRDGCCRTSEEDVGSHTVCVELTAEFLAFSRDSGNDLSTPHPEYGFPGLKPGESDRHGLAPAILNALVGSRSRACPDRLLPDLLPDG